MTTTTNHRVERIDPDKWAGRAADIIASALTAAVRQRGVGIFAVSGGSTPAPVFAELAERALPWASIVIVQVDERIAPEGSAERNLTAQTEAFAGLPVRMLPLPIGDDLESSVSGIEAFEAELASVAGSPPVIDVVHLGLGGDGHTASLVPGDPAIDELTRWVVPTAETYQGTYRLTLTRAVLEQAALTVWLVTGADKQSVIDQLTALDYSIPAGHLNLPQSVIVTDQR